jgi:dihydroorotase
MSKSAFPTCLLLRNGRILDPSRAFDQTADLLIENGRISRIEPRIGPPDHAELIDVTGKLVVPGLIDMHVHLRDPGYPEKETVLSGCEAAAEGGFTSVACLPNTQPVLDCPDILHELRHKAESASARVYPIACATLGMRGKELSDTDGLLNAGAVGFSDDGLPIESASLMRMLLGKSEERGFPVCPHSEVFELTRGGHMHEGVVSRELGIAGMPSEGEAVMVERDIRLVREVGGHLHILHISVRRAIDLVRKARAEGLRVSCEAMPHHLALTDEDVRVLGTQGKMSPPLRSMDDRDAVLEGLADGTIEVLATDHAPHTNEEKLRAFPEAPNGILGLETAVGTFFTYLVAEGILSAPQVIEKLTTNPARLLGLEAGTLQPGSLADVTVIDPDAFWQVNANDFRSKSRNTPFHGWTLQGRAVLTLLGGRITHNLL